MKDVCFAMIVGPAVLTVECLGTTLLALIARNFSTKQTLLIWWHGTALSEGREKLSTKVFPSFHTRFALQLMKGRLIHHRGRSRSELGQVLSRAEAESGRCDSSLLVLSSCTPA